MQKFKDFWGKSTFNKIIVIVVAFLVIGLIGSAVEKDSSTGKQEATTLEVVQNNNSDDKEDIKETETEEITEAPTLPQVQVIDFSGYTKSKAEKWCNKHKLNFESSEEYSNDVKVGKFISQSLKAGKSVDEGTTIEIIYSLGKKPTKEEENALKKAESYSEMMHMSKKAIYDQLTSEYGENFEAEAAQYAIDHLDADYKENALEKAKSYQDTMSMSKKAIYDQLISEYGEKFTTKEAQYAIDHLDD